MDIDDPVMPAVVHLTGASAPDVLSAAVRAAGGHLHSARASQVQYRPGTDLVVRYRADVTWADGRRRADETLLAAAHPDGALPGTIPVVTEADGRELIASVWRWPFDPVVVGLQDAVTPGGTDDLVGGILGPRPDVEVIAYRPTERAVVRLRATHGAVAYLKAVPPAELLGLVARHRVLLDVGLPVPEVLASDADRGLLLLRARPGTTLRERIKGDLPGWPSAAAVADLIAAVHRADPAGLARRGGRLADGIGHGRLVATVAPELAPKLDVLTSRFMAEARAVAARSGAVVHGDLHEGQLIVDPEGTMTGLLDVDDLSIGDPVDDHATLIAHLRFRAAVLAPDAPVGDRLRRYVAALHDHARGAVGAEAIDVAVAAVLVGLSTGPFRIQHADWRAQTTAIVDAAMAMAAPHGDMRDFSADPHDQFTHGPQGEAVP